jgi:transcriptional regulator with XRE-family HTH domain
LLVVESVIVLGRYVRERRAVLEMTQESLGALVGKPQKWVSRLENEQKELPDPETMAALATALGVRETELLQAAGYLHGLSVRSRRHGSVSARLNRLHWIRRGSVRY